MTAAMTVGHVGERMALLGSGWAMSLARDGTRWRVALVGSSVHIGQDRSLEVAVRKALDSAFTARSAELK